MYELVGPGIYPGEPNHGASSETRKPCKTGYIGGLQGVPPLWVQKWFKTSILKYGLPVVPSRGGAEVALGV